MRIIFSHTPEVTAFPFGPIGTEAAIEIETDFPATIESVSFVYHFRNSLQISDPGRAPVSTSNSHPVFLESRGHTVL